MERNNSNEKPQLFENKILDSLTKTTPLTSILVYGTVVISFLYVALEVVGVPVGTTIAWFIFALFFWTLAEYLLHRFLFHWVSDSKIVMRMHYLMHGVHHDHPLDEERLLMPPVPGLILSSLLFGLFYVMFSIFGHSHLTWAFFPGFFLGYLLYSFMHYAIHKFKPPRFLKYLWLHHNLHHHKYPDKAFGVSNVFWDKVFGTMPPEDERRAGKRTVSR